jgi:hypothetical protein
MAPPLDCQDVALKMPDSSPTACATPGTVRWLNSMTVADVAMAIGLVAGPHGTGEMATRLAFCESLRAVFRLILRIRLGLVGTGFGVRVVFKPGIRDPCVGSTHAGERDSPDYGDYDRAH